jgi:hypothetical protein
VEVTVEVVGSVPVREGVKVGVWVEEAVGMIKSVRDGSGMTVSTGRIVSRRPR